MLTMPLHEIAQQANQARLNAIRLAAMLASDPTAAEAVAAARSAAVHLEALRDALLRMAEAEGSVPS